MPKHYRQGSLSTILSCLLLTISNSNAIAAAPSWQGPYLGGYVGYGIGSNHASTTAGAVTGTSYFSNANNVGMVNTSGTFTNASNSPMIGFVAGHDWAWKHIIYGLAFDYGRMPLSTTHNGAGTYSDGTGQYTVYSAMSTDWLFTLRGRVGCEATVYGPTLLYFTGGMAISQLTINNNYMDNTSYAGRGGNSSTQNQIGWTAGAGIEAMPYGRTSFFVEYLYVHLPSMNTSGTISNTQGGFGIPAQSANSPLTTTGHFYANVIKVGVNYRFDE